MSERQRSFLATVRGHRYEMTTKDGEIRVVRFVQDPKYNPELPACDGILCQDLLCVLLDRVRFMDEQQPHPLNATIIESLEQAFVAFEQRALEQKMRKAGDCIEELPKGPDGHRFTMV